MTWNVSLKLDTGKALRLFRDKTNILEQMNGVVKSTGKDILDEKTSEEGEIYASGEF